MHSKSLLNEVSCSCIGASTIRCLPFIFACGAICSVSELNVSSGNDGAKAPAFSADELLKFCGRREVVLIAKSLKLGLYVGLTQGGGEVPAQLHDRRGWCVG